MTITLYGIPNCDTVKKCRTWLAEREIAYAFHDYKKQGAEAERLAGWIDQVGWEALLNRRGTTFRALKPEQKADIDADKALAIMVAHPSCIKRPVVEHPGGVLVGFDADAWAKVLASG